MFYVIEGFLDVILPTTNPQSHGGPDTTMPSQENVPSGRASNQSTSDRESRQPKPQEEGKHLFTVKPGGIAGYLCEAASEFLSDQSFDPSSIVMQHCLICGHQGEDGHLCGIPSTSCFGTAVGETPYRSPDTRKEAYIPSLSTW